MPPYPAGATTVNPSQVAAHPARRRSCAAPHTSKPDGGGIDIGPTALLPVRSSQR